MRRPSLEAAEIAAAPLAGKTVAVVHAAWHSCGSYQVNVSQIAAYRALGARVLSIAMMDALGPAAPQGARWEAYLAATRDIGADRRYFSGAPTSGALAAPRFLIDGYWRLIHGDQASWLIELAKRAPLPAGFEAESIDLIHANHYFTLALRRHVETRAPRSGACWRRRTYRRANICCATRAASSSRPMRPMTTC